MLRFTPPSHSIPTLLTLLAAGGQVFGVQNLSHQPLRIGLLNDFEIVGNSFVSAQQAFLGTADKIYIIDKTENNAAQINGHPAWASEWSVSTRQTRAMDIVTNSFCAGGTVLGNGTWLNVGGNQAVTYGGETALSQIGAPPYGDSDGGRSVRLLNPCDDGTCNWAMDQPLSSRRWYPTLETLEDGSAIILGGCQWGGFVNDAAQSNPTYEFYPSRGPPVVSSILQNTLPANLFPLAWLLPSGRLFIQSNWKSSLLDYKQNQETPLVDMIDAVRVYPASAGVALLPLSSQDNYKATIMFCGGSNVSSVQWGQVWDLPHYPASSSCVMISPDDPSPQYMETDPLPEGRTMGNLILLPDGRVFCLNGAKTGVAGYGNTTYAIGQSFADQPNLSPIIYDPSAPAGTRWKRDGLKASTIPRMYHSSAVLLPDGSVFVSGSNPNSDINMTTTYPTEYRIEQFYPSYYNQRRPEIQNPPSQLGYGGPYFEISLSVADLFGNKTTNIQTAKVVVLRSGFSTHTMNMGQRAVLLDHSYTISSNGTAKLYVSQLPPNPAIMPPGPAYLFLVVNGVPSIGVPVMVGSGKIETQKMGPNQPLPQSVIAPLTSSESQKTSSGASSVMDYGKADAMHWLKTAGALLAVLSLS